MRLFKYLIYSWLLIIINGLGLSVNAFSEQVVQLNYLQIESPTQLQIAHNASKGSSQLYKRHYPQGKRGDYSYILIRTFDNWRGAETVNLDDALAWSSLYTLEGEATKETKHPAAFLVVNEMQVHAGKQSRYLELELSYFKPFHTERVNAGVMNNWQLLRRDFPYGSVYRSDYLTLNGFDSWEDIKKNNPPDIWKKAHGDVDFNLIHDEILGLRDTVNIEIWKRVNLD